MGLTWLLFLAKTGQSVQFRSIHLFEGMIWNDLTRIAWFNSHTTSLVGGFNPSEKKLVSWDDSSQYLGEKNMFQTTNQIRFCGCPSHLWKQLRFSEVRVPIVPHLQKRLPVSGHGYWQLPLVVCWLCFSIATWRLGDARAARGFLGYDPTALRFPAPAWMASST